MLLLTEEANIYLKNLQESLKHRNFSGEQQEV